MRSKAILGITLGIITSCVMMSAPVRADEWTQQTKLTFSQPVEIPGRVLPAGTYWFVLPNNISDRDVVQIFSEDWRTLYATVFTVPSERRNPPDDTLLTFAENESDGTPALVKWFYPGETTGHEFEYFKSEESGLVHATQKTISVSPHGSRVGF
jgi:hypothetical protein